MSDTALFVGWGLTHPGREHHAIATFKEWTEVLDDLKAKSEIDGYEHVLLTPHGGELNGFTLVHGDEQKLALMLTREDMQRLRRRAMSDHAKFSIIWATTGETVSHEYEAFEEVVTEIERELVTA